MRRVTSPTCRVEAPRRSRLRGRVLAGALALALTAGAAATPAAANPDLEARQAQVRQDAEASKAQVAQDEQALGAASQALLAAQGKLEDARAKLSDTRVQLAAAREADARLAQRLKAEQEQLARDEEAVTKAQAAVAEQEALIVQAARQSYQQRSGLEGVGIALGSESTDGYGQRVQWDTTVFDTSQARLDTLAALRASLQAARDRQADTAARIAADKAESARNVTRIAALVKQAERLEAEVAGLVAAADAARQAAQAELDAEKARYDELMAEDQRIAAELAALRSNPATYVSSQGFIRPVDAEPGSAFGMRFHPILRAWRMHRGTDFGASCGAPLHAAQAGRVVSAGPRGGFGNYTVIDHGNVGGKSVQTGYAHQLQVLVSPGQLVTQGQLIGYVGTTGLSTGCHLHLQVYVNGDVVNPLTYIP